jgi:hypothetical protein
MVDDERMLLDMRVDAPAPRVWAALREAEEIPRWFGWDYDGLSAEIQQIFVDEAEPDDDARTLRWPTGDRIEVVELDEASSEVRVRRHGHTGIESFDGVFDPIDEGWITFLQGLRFYLERHDGEPRRTVSTLGVGLGSEDDPLLTRLGLRALGDDPVGAPYTVQRADGTTFSGEIFFQTDLQVGLSVVEEGDALLVVARTPPTSAPPDGEAMFLLSTYGLDDAALAEVERRWTGWWSQT